MIADEIDGVGPAKVISERAYFASRVAVGCGLMLAFGLAYLGVARSFRISFPAGLVGGSGYGATLASGPLVNDWLRRRGLARVGKPGAAWTRAPLFPGEEGDAEVVEVGIEPSFMVAGILASGIGALFFGEMLFTSRAVLRNHQFDGFDWCSVALIFFFALGAAWLLFVACWLKPATRIDADGIWGYPRDLAIRRRFIPWSAVAAAEVETYVGRSGKPLAIRPIFYDRHGERLIRLDVIGIALADQERLVRAVQAWLHEPAAG